MWTDLELKQLESTLEDVELDHILTEEEIEIIKQNSTRYENLQNRVIVPLHRKKVRFLFKSDLWKINANIFSDRQLLYSDLFTNSTCIIGCTKLASV